MLLRCIACALLALVTQQVYAAAASDSAVQYPNKSVRWVVPFPPGAANDVIARLISGKLSEALGQQFVIDNRAGAGGLLGADTVAKAVADGYTLMLSNVGPSVTSPLLAKTPPFQVDDFTQVIFFGYSPLLVLAYPGFPPKTPKDLVDYLKANPGKVNWGSSGTNGPTHVGLALFQVATNTQFTHVPYKGSAPAQADLMGGQIQLLEASLPSVEPQVKSGRIRVIAVADAKRLALLPDVPTLAEAGIAGADALAWFGMTAPARMPRPIVMKLNAASNKVLMLPDLRRRLQELGLEVVGGTPEDYSKFVDNEVERIKKLIKAGHLKPE